MRNEAPGRNPGNVGTCFYLLRGRGERVLSLPDISDRLEIQDLIVHYSRAVDTRSWDDLDGIFADGAVIDYTAMGGIRGDLATVKAYLAETFATFGPTQHMMGLPAIELDGDVASSVTACHNPMVLVAGEDPLIMLCGLNYHHRFVRTTEGWRISDLREESCYMRLLPTKAERRRPPRGEAESETDDQSN